MAAAPAVSSEGVPSHESVSKLAGQFATSSINNPLSPVRASSNSLSVARAFFAVSVVLHPGICARSLAVDLSGLAMLGLR